MILPFLAALLTALGPLLRGSWDLWARCLLHLLTIAGLSLWLSLRILAGHIPLPSSRTLWWTALLAALGSLSVWLSPIPGFARPQWWIFLNVLWMFPAMAALTQDQRERVDETVRAAAWILVTLAFYQRIAFHQPRPASAFQNENIYAGAILLLLPIAVERGDYLLAGGLLWNLFWDRSVGAWLGLSSALIATQRGRSTARFWTGAIIALSCAVFIYAKLGTPESLHRWWWWKAAFHMALRRPAFGYGPGTFAAVSSAFLSKAPGDLFSYFTHNYFLQTAAEMGIPFCLLWASGLWTLAERARPAKRFGIMAAGIHSLWDYPLSIPSNLWLFGYLAASSIPDNPEGVNIPARLKLPLVLAVLGLGAAFSNAVRKEWRGHLALDSAKEEFAAGRWEQARLQIEIARKDIPDDPDVPLSGAALFLSRGRLLEGAACLEEAVRLNPYRPSIRTQLALARRKLELPDSPPSGSSVLSSPETAAP